MLVAGGMMMTMRPAARLSVLHPTLCKVAVAGPAPSHSAYSKVSVAIKNAQFSSTSRASANERKPPSLLSLADLSVEQIQSLIDTSAQFKSAVKSTSLALEAPARSNASASSSRSTAAGALPQILEGKQIAVMFTKRSTRTRVASETSIASLGGHPIFLSPQDIQLGVNESLYDTAKVVSSMVDGIMARVGTHEEIETLAANSSVPVVNALSARYHPTQILADLLTLVEHFPSPGAFSAQSTAAQGTSLQSLAGLKVAWVGDSNNILNDMLVALPRLGINLAVATPKPQGAMYARDQVVWATMQDGLRQVQSAGVKVGQVDWSHDPLQAVHDADVIVTDTWISMGDEASKEQRLRDFKGFQVTEQLARAGGAKENWKFMHCLPRKSQEVDDEIFYGPRSLVFPEAENRKWTIMAIFDRMFGRWEL
ncbi:ornithine carbamoyltransferase [Tilletiaria anomala UBC 951]|uniref:ornithine carbamoyltransferase n=1 Tax=Tilletiaria anomala (strain ATCC 24038 / CBS 436.72 / UBC 951) TaxID=1037660 RepID=A0A066VEC6_TILAU|nr:ornithine carbamoyltransferase [Tilletiaria anomala UBC 951]KDN40102.1 ornithine carbamoyltransferase [Tilletiaria anomala UBC 951]